MGIRGRSAIHCAHVGGGGRNELRPYEKICEICGVGGKYGLASRTNTSAYTLLEVMLVVIIIGMLLVFVLKNLTGSAEDARRRMGDNVIKGVIGTALAEYEMKNGFYPTQEQGLKSLVEKPSSEPVPQYWHQLLTQLPKDPWNREFIYVYPGAHNKDGFDLSSRGRDGQEGTEDDITNWQTQQTQ